MEDIIIPISPFEPDSATEQAILKKHLTAAGRKGGNALKKKRGNKHFTEMANERWAKWRAKNKKK